MSTLNYLLLNFWQATDLNKIPRISDNPTLALIDFWTLHFGLYRREVIILSKLLKCLWKNLFICLIKIMLMLFSYENQNKTSLSIFLPCIWAVKKSQISLSVGYNTTQNWRMRMVGLWCQYRDALSRGFSNPRLFHSEYSKIPFKF